tara:strand:+ start:231 stop:1322 length:1092 start_codon:yes stop_codon:yes gene_type:complete
MNKNIKITIYLLVFIITIIIIISIVFNKNKNKLYHPSTTKIKNIKWMTKLYNNTDYFKTKTINEVVFPGTHNSITGNLVDKSNVNEIINYHSHINDKYKPFSTFIKYIQKIADPVNITQILSCINQIKSGIRYLDIRVAYKNKIWTTHHGPLIFDSNLIDTVIIPIKKWLKNKGKEILIVRFSHFYGDYYTTKEINDLLSNIVTLWGGKNGNHILLTNKYKPTTKLKDIQGKYNKVIIIWEKNTINKDTLHVNWKDHTINKFKNNNCPSNWKEVKELYLNNKNEKDNLKLNICPLHFYQNPNNLLIETTLYNPFQPTLIYKGKQINKKINKYFDNMNISLNIITLDAWKYNIDIDIFIKLNKI